MRDHKNYFKPKAGINLENVDTLRNKTSSLSGIQRYIVVVIDEMKIQANLVFDKYSGDLIGFVDLGDPMTNYASLGEEDVSSIVKADRAPFLGVRRDAQRGAQASAGCRTN